MKNLELERKSLPNEPGVYLFKDKAGSIIYVGKAINLKKRVNQYFLKTSHDKQSFYSLLLSSLHQQS